MKRLHRAAALWAALSMATAAWAKWHYVMRGTHELAVAASYLEIQSVPEPDAPDLTEIVPGWADGMELWFVGNGDFRLYPSDGGPVFQGAYLDFPEAGVKIVNATTPTLTLELDRDGRYLMHDAAVYGYVYDAAIYGRPLLHLIRADWAAVFRPDGTFDYLHAYSAHWQILE